MFSLTACASPTAVPFSREGSVSAMTTFHAPAYEDDERSSRAPIDLIAVIDRSSSMQDDRKLQLVQETLHFVLNQLKSGDRLALVTYDDAVETVLDLVSMNAQGKERAGAAVDRIHVGGQTNLSGGLLQGLDIVRTRTFKNDVASLLLFTDGIANRGLTSTPRIVRAVEGYFRHIDVCAVYTFGYGRDHDSDMLRQIAEAGNGLYYFIEHQDSIPSAFADCLGGLLSVCAQNICIRIEALGDATIERVETHLKTKELAPSHLYEVVIGDLYSEERRDVMCTVTLPFQKEPSDSTPIVRFTCTYFNVVALESMRTQAEASVSRPVHTVPEPTVNEELELQRNRLEACAALREAGEAARTGDLERGRAILKMAKSHATASPVFHHPYTQAIYSDLSEAVDGMASTPDYRERGSHMLWKAQQSHAHQRSNTSEDQAGYGYVTRAKVGMKSKLAQWKK